ncbi:MAG TPA: RNA 2',3'-cyclic phosphodiesterase [Casimicrobiaceae bacterium]
MTDGAKEQSRRLFFALWPDEPARALIAGLAREVALESGGRPTALNHIHLTLAFVGEQPAIRIDSLRRLAGVVRARAFMLALDEIGGFRRTGIAWLGASAAQPGLAALHDDLAHALQSRGFPVDERPYAPHLTLARRSTTVIDRRLSQPIRWRVNSFTLMASELAASGPAYRTIAEWPLVAG